MKKKTSHGGVGFAGVVAAAAAAAGAYYLYGSKDAAKNRAKTAVWMKKAEAHIVREAKKGVKIAHEKISAEINEETKKITKAAKKIK